MQCFILMALKLLYNLHLIKSVWCLIILEISVMGKSVGMDMTEGKTGAHVYF